MEDYNRGDWCSMGCVAEVYHNDHMIGTSYGLFGIESDGDDDYRLDIEKEQILAAFADARRNRDNAKDLDLRPVLQDVIDGLEEG